MSDLAFWAQVMTWLAEAREDRDRAMDERDALRNELDAVYEWIDNVAGDLPPWAVKNLP